MAEQQGRRQQQDYVRLDEFLSLEDWQRLGATNSNRERCTYLCDVLYRRLQLRLPTEQTYAAMVSVVSCVDQASGDKGTQAWSLHVLLQELKATWRSTCTRLKKWHKDPTTLLPCLPAGFEDLPEEIQAAHGSTRPADPASRPIRADAVAAEASQVRLRQTHAEHPNNPRNNLIAQNQVAQSMAIMQLLQHAQQPPQGLHNLQLFPQNMRAPQRQAGRAQGLTSGLAAGALESGTPHVATAKALMDSPWNEANKPEEEEGKAPRASSSLGPEKGNKVEEVKAQRPEKGNQVEEAEEKLVSAITGHTSEEKTSQAITNAETLQSKNKRDGQKEADADWKERPMKRPAQCKSMKRPASSKPMAKPAKVCAEAAPQANKPNFAFEAKSWGSCRSEYYRDKSYIRYWDTQDSKWRMIIGSTDQTNHALICEKLIPYVKQGKGRACSRSAQSYFEREQKLSMGTAYLRQ